MRGVHKISFPLVPELLNHLLRQAIRVHDRVMTLHDACTSGTSRVLTEASFQRLKIEALIPAPADYKLLSVIKFLNAQSIELIEFHHQLCRIYAHTRLDGQHISCRNSIGRCLIIIRSIARTSRPFISIFFLTSQKIPAQSASAFSERQRGGAMCHSGSTTRRQTSTTQVRKFGPTV